MPGSGHGRSATPQSHRRPPARGEVLRRAGSWLLRDPPRLSEFFRVAHDLPCLVRSCREVDREGVADFGGRIEHQRSGPAVDPCPLRSESALNACALIPRALFCPSRASAVDILRLLTRSTRRRSRPGTFVLAERRAETSAYPNAGRKSNRGEDTRSCNHRDPASPRSRVRPHASNGPRSQKGCRRS